MNKNIYVLVEWPESQLLMEEEWFREEAVLHLDLSSAYFVPRFRLFNSESLENEREGKI